MRHVYCITFIGLVLCRLLFGVAAAGEPPQEHVTTTPVILDGVLYVASSTYPADVVIYGR